MEKRIEWIDFAKGIGIIMVVLGHCFDGKHFHVAVIYSTHMPLFFFLAGLCFKPEKYTLKELAQKRAKQLLIPLISFTVIITILSKVMLGTPLNLLYRGFPHALWFLMILYMSQLLFWTINKRIKNINIECLLIIVFAAIGLNFRYNNISLPYSLLTVFSATVFLSSGYLSRNLIKTIVLNYHNIAQFAWILLGAILIITVKIFDVRNNLQANTISPSIIGYISAYIGIATIISLSTCLTQFKSFWWLIEWFGQNTLTIMCVHLLFAVTYQYYLRDIMTNDYLYKFTQLIFVFSTSSLCAYLVDKRAKWILGK